MRRITNSKKLEKKMSIAALLSRFQFNFETGEITRKSNGLRADQLHNFQGQARYRQVQIYIWGLNIKLCAHRMIWAAYNGRWPEDGMVIDHLNSDTFDNRISNLEEVTELENKRRAKKSKKE